MPVIMGKAEYPQNIIEKIKSKYKNVKSLDALSIAKQCGNIKAVNIVLIGVMARSTDIEKEVWIESIREVVPQKFLDINIRAFEAGYAIG
jgi:indolepyruvate ferredoxin oxidoreductase beta subunit